MLDINILLLWQDFRNGAGGCLTDFMTKMSYIGEMKTMLIITALIYWCVTRVTTISTKGDPPNGGSCSPETHSPRS